MAIKVKLKVDEALKVREMSQRDLVKLTGLRPMAVSALSRNRIERLTLEHLERIADALDITDIRELIDFEEV